MGNETQKIIVSGRATGKTTKAIKESAKTGLYILAPNQFMADSIFELAQKLELKIPYPVTLRDIMKGNGGRALREGVIVDEGLKILESMLGTRVHMITMSERSNQEESE